MAKESCKLLSFNRGIWKRFDQPDIDSSIYKWMDTEGSLPGSYPITFFANDFSDTKEWSFDSKESRDRVFRKMKNLSTLERGVKKFRVASRIRTATKDRHTIEVTNRGSTVVKKVIR